MWLRQIDNFLVQNIGTILEWEGIIFFTLILFTSFRKVYCLFKDHIYETDKKKYYNIIGEYLENSKLSDPAVDRKKFPSKFTFREFLADVGASIDGELKLKVLKLYNELNFYNSDLKLLNSNRDFTRLKAIDRLEKLAFSIPEKQHLELLDDSNYMIRFLGILHYVKQHGSHSLFPLISFIDQNKFEKKGLLYNLIEVLGGQDPEAIKFLFERTNNVDLEISLLSSAFKKPPKDIDEIIYRKIRMDNKKTQIVGALKVLTYFPSDKLFKLIKILAKDLRWVVRLHTVKLLRQYDFDQIEPLLVDFFNDTSYLVRLEATRVLLEYCDNKNFSAMMVSEDLIKLTGHPSQVILKHLLEMRDLSVLKLKAA